VIVWIVSAVSLSITMGLCVAGVLTPKALYDANLFQRLGMAGMFAFSWPRLVQLFETHTITGNCMPVSAQVCGHVGIALYATGTAFKVWWFHRKSCITTKLLEAK
jgi:hypothetical protein